MPAFSAGRLVGAPGLRADRAGHVDDEVEVGGVADLARDRRVRGAVGDVAVGDVDVDGVDRGGRATRAAVGPQFEHEVAVRGLRRIPDLAPVIGCATQGQDLVDIGQVGALPIRETGSVAEARLDLAARGVGRSCGHPDGEAVDDRAGRDTEPEGREPLVLVVPCGGGDAAVGRKGVRRVGPFVGSRGASWRLGPCFSSRYGRGADAQKERRQDEDSPADGRQPPEQG